MPASSIKAPVLKELQRQVNQELGAAHSYLALAIWCDLQNLKGFARYFSKQSFEERGHSQKLIKHLLDRGVLPALTAVPEPRTNFKELLDVAKYAQAMEIANSGGINTCYEVALREKDYACQPLLLELIAEQVEEEDWTGEMVDRVEQANCAGGLIELDRHLEKLLTEDGADAAKGE